MDQAERERGRLRRSADSTVAQRASRGESRAPGARRATRPRPAARTTCLSPAPPCWPWRARKRCPRPARAERRGRMVRERGRAVERRSWPPSQPTPFPPPSTSPLLS
eukprot:4653492-Pleurochrysis_carterae.AAC.2